MNMLSSLTSAYERLEKTHEVPTFGYSSQSIHGCIVLTTDGSLAGPPVFWNKNEKGRKTAKTEEVPYSGGRSGRKPPPYFLWDNTAYVLGVTAKDFDPSGRHRSFKELHFKVLDNSPDEELQAVVRFLQNWQPEKFTEAGFTDEVRDLNFMFRLASKMQFVHQGDAAKTIWLNTHQSDSLSEGVCLITGKRAPIARLHPPIISFEKQARIVSFNENAYTSYGHEQGDNGQISEIAAFKYTAALNRFLARGSKNQIQIGDASTVFWADASDFKAAEEAESGFMALLDGIDENLQSEKIRTVLDKIHAGRPFTEIEPDLPDGVRFYVLGLAPNAARLSVRFWIEDDFGEIAKRFIAHFEAMRIEPPPKELNPSMWRCLIETAVLRKSENIPPKLAGDWLRAILTGRPYPQTLLATLLMRLRADKDVNGLRVAMLKAVLVKRSMEVPMSLDPDLDDPGYLLGRLFAIFEYVQTQALGGKVNATIRDQYYGTASATPRAVFPALLRKATHHLSRLRKDKAGWAVVLDRKIGEIFERAEAEKLFVPTLTMQRQALFAVGYYHQRNDLYRAKDVPAAVQPQE